MNIPKLIQSSNHHFCIWFVLPSRMSPGGLWAHPSHKFFYPGRSPGHREEGASSDNLYVIMEGPTWLPWQQLILAGKYPRKSSLEMYVLSYCSKRSLTTIIFKYIVLICILLAALFRPKNAIKLSIENP